MECNCNIYIYIYNNILSLYCLLDIKGMDFRNIVENNHSHVEVYKRMLKDKDKELQQVNNRLRRMLMAWNR